MNLSVGIVGLPNVGKSTLFNALLAREVAVAANYPFATIDPNVGVVEVPDERLEALTQLIKDTEGVKDNFKIIPAATEFVDIAGLVKGAATGEGLGNQFLSHIRDVDAIVMVLRDFSDEGIIRSHSVEPKSDKEVLETELIIKDLETVAKIVDRVESQVRSVKQPHPIFAERELANKLKVALEQGKMINSLEFTDEEKVILASYQLLTAKPFIFVLNSDEGDLNKEAPIEGAIRISAKIEGELAKLSKEEQKEYLKELGIEKSSLERLITKAFETLGLIVFLTAGPKEVRAWPILAGTKAPQAAGTIHTDFERGFIAAEVIDWQKLIEVGGWKQAKAKGEIKAIGKNDEIKDGYVIEFRFSV